MKLSYVISFLIGTLAVAFSNSVGWGPIPGLLLAVLLILTAVLVVTGLYEDEKWES